ncbi:MAG: type II toxin-antitoxin system RelE/ParE family toxin [Bacteroidetes bacterium]|nr:type II toxin-antitoxin system RelE/ParE family toxin [Bacteroidota bacterium]
MSYSIELSANFKKEAKRLSKKYPSLKTELAELFAVLEENPTTGTPLGNDIYKIRLAIASKNKGKSGGARVLSFVKVTKTTVLLFSIYSKGEVDNLTDKQIQELIKDYL